jgi:Tol biopolymer transport system component
VYVQYDGKGNGQIYSFDTSTNKRARIHALMSFGNVPTASPSIALSPDRKWIAMTGLFRPSEKEMKQGKAVRSLWKISVDGKQTIRLSDPIPLLNGRACQNDSQCSDLGQVCNVGLGQCTKRNYTLGLSSPEWSNDGKTVYVVFSQHWSGASGRLEGGATLATVPANGGTMNLRNVVAGCQQITHPSFHPKDNSLVAYHSVCSSGLSGFHLYDGGLSKDGTKLIKDPNVNDQMGKVAWMPDGSGFFFLASTNWDTNNDGKTDLQGTGLVFYHSKDGKMEGAIPPLNQGLSFGQYAVSPNSDAFVLCVQNNQKSTFDLYWFSLGQKKSDSKQLTTDGKSCAPSW